jgi:hypothetical protein
VIDDRAAVPARVGSAAVARAFPYLRQLSAHVVEQLISDSHNGPTPSGERNPVELRPDQLLNLAQALNVSVDDLVRTNHAQR